MLTGFKNFIMRGDVIVLAVGLVIALAFSGLITAFTTDIISPLIARLQGGKAIGLGVQLGQTGNAKTFLDLGSFISAVIYFVIFMAVIYFVIVVPYKHIQARRGHVAFGDPAPTKTCPFCLSDDLPVAAVKCKYCASEQPGTTPTPPTAGVTGPATCRRSSTSCRRSMSTSRCATAPASSTPRRCTSSGSPAATPNGSSLA